MNPQDGKVGKCKAEKGKCPFGKENHFSSQEKAEKFRDEYEKKNGLCNFTSNLSKKGVKKHNADLISGYELKLNNIKQTTNEGATARRAEEYIAHLSKETYNQIVGKKEKKEFEMNYGYLFNI